MSDAGEAGDGGDATDAGDATGAPDGEDLEAIREQKKAELLNQSGFEDPEHVESEAHLDELLADNDVVLVDFYADWCGPCQMIEPAVEAIAAETPAVVAKVDVDDHQAIARDYGVQGVPTLFLYQGGEQVDRLVGMQDQETLFALVDRYL